MDASTLLAAYRCLRTDAPPAGTVAALARIAAGSLPIEQLSMLELVGDRAPDRAVPHSPASPTRLERLVAMNSEGRVVAEGEEHAAVARARLRPLALWCQGRAVASWRDGEPHPEGAAAVFAMACIPANRVALALPLKGRGDECGACVLLGQQGTRFTAAHRHLAEQFAEPLSVAFDALIRAKQVSGLRAAAAAEREALLRRLGRAEEGDEAIVGADGGLRPVMQRVDLVARSDAPVLILGETGAGKEVIARAIHERSPRTEAPFVRVNCGAIPPELIDSELFGHERGAFTGAIAERRGWFERADRGTLFLDEIGDLPLAAQVRLLRVMQEGVLQRVGGEETLRVDVRVVAATHRDLPAMVRAGKFREDLWYRLAVFPILLPPLRDRLDDIAPLAKQFARRAARRLGVHEVAPSEGDLDLLRRYPWPGNVRELASVMDRAVILGNGESLEVRQALGPIGPARPDEPERAASGEPSAPAALSLDDAMRSHIERVLRLTRGQIEGPRGAARALRINPHTLRSRMRKLGLRWSTFRPEEPPLTP